MKLDQPDEGLQAQRLARDIRKQIADSNPTDHYGRSELAWSHHNLGFVLGNLERSDEAIAEHGEALKLRQQLIREHPSNGEYFDTGLLSYSHLRALLAVTERWQEAETLYRSGIEFGKAIDNRLLQAVMRGNLLEVLQRQERSEEELAQVERDAIADLQAVAATGWRMTKQHLDMVPGHRLQNHPEVQKMMNSGE